MVGDMGRTELASSAEEGATSLFESAERLRALPDYVQVMPGALAGSVCGRGLSATPFSTIGFERRFNRAFSIPDRAAFVDFMLREIPPRPPRAVENRLANLGIDAGRGLNGEWGPSWGSQYAPVSALARRVRGASAVLALVGSAAAPSLRTAMGQTAILVRPRGVVTGDVPRVNHAEPWVAVDPRNPARLVATGILDSGGEFVAYSSRDGGVTWSRGRTDRGNTTFPGGDPIALFDGRGTAFLATISPFRVWRSNDAGVTWDGPTMVPGRSFDREYLAVRTVPDGARHALRRRQDTDPRLRSSGE
jgi:hypothetical protein